MHSSYCFILITLVLMLPADSAQAEFIKIYSQDGCDRYIDNSPADEGNGIKGVWTMTDCATSQSEDGLTWRSKKTYFLISCASKKFNNQLIHYYKEAHGLGPVVDTVDMSWIDEWQPIPPRTFAEGVYVSGCKKHL